MENNNNRQTCYIQINRKMEERITSEKINPTMLATETFYHLLEQVQKSGLNFHMQASPYSAVISVKKSFIKDMSGKLILPLPRNENVSAIIDRNEKLELDIKTLTKLHEDTLRDCERAYETIKSLETKQKELRIKVEETKINKEKLLEAEVKKLESTIKNRDKEIADLKNANRAATEASEILKETLTENRLKQDDERVNLENENRVKFEQNQSEIKALEQVLVYVKIENKELTEKCVLKDNELREAFNEREKLEEKLESLLDVLYGCPECGLNSCECKDSVDEKDPRPDAQPSPPPTPSPRLPPPATAWTPPPTPPCTSCGGINFGPSPSDLCFVCIPPLQSTSPHNSSSSPTTTPPGTPPSMRLK